LSWKRKMTTRERKETTTTHERKRETTQGKQDGGGMGREGGRCQHDAGEGSGRRRVVAV
jgi:hypothetical protein